MKRFLCAFLLLALTLSASACMEDGYDDIEMTETYEWFVRGWGPLAADEDGIVKVADMLLTFYESGRLRAKTRAFDRVQDVAMLTEGNLDAAKNMRSGQKLAEVQAALGAEGTEIMRLNLSDEENPGVQRVLAWKDAQDRAVEAMFELDDGEWVLFATLNVLP